MLRGEQIYQTTVSHASICNDLSILYLNLNYINKKILLLTPKNLYWFGHGHLLSWGPGRKSGCSESLFRFYKIPTEPKSGYRVFIPNSLYLLIVSHPTNQQKYSILNWEGFGKIKIQNERKEWIKKKYCIKKFTKKRIIWKYKKNYKKEQMKIVSLLIDVNSYLWSDNQFVVRWNTPVERIPRNYHQLLICRHACCCLY